jgi:hypothetical protein
VQTRELTGIKSRPIEEKQFLTQQKNNNKTKTK